MTRRRPQVIERRQFADGEPANVTTRARARRERTDLVVTALASGGVFREGTVPTQYGFVRVRSWPEKTEYSLILQGAVYTRLDFYGVSRRSLSVSAGIFAKEMILRDIRWRSSGGQP